MADDGKMLADFDAVAGQADHGAVIPSGYMGIAVAEDGETLLLMPNGPLEDKTGHVPIPFLALTEVAVRFMQDPDFIREMAEAFEARDNG